MTPHSRQILQKSLGYLESKIVQYRVIEPNSLGVKELRTGKQIKPRSQRQLQAPQTLHRAYVKEEKTRIANAAALAAEKVENREARKLVKEQKAKEAKERAEVMKKAREGAQAARGRGGAKLARSRTARQSKYDAEGADMRRLETAMSVLSLCGIFPAST